ncbi:MAG: hypothetical protein WDM79_08550 [Terricaulis sp.]
MTTGGARFPLLPWLVMAVGGLAVALVNASSNLLEAERDGESLTVWAPFVWEFSSYLTIMALTPLVGEAMRRIPPQRETLVRFAATHLGLTVIFSLAHCAGMVALRKLAYALAGSFYDFSHGNLARELFYEWRKDVLTYVLIGLTYWFFQWRASQARAPAAPAASKSATARRRCFCRRRIFYGSRRPAIMWNSKPPRARTWCAARWRLGRVSSPARASCACTARAW